MSSALLGDCSTPQVRRDNPARGGGSSRRGLRAWRRAQTRRERHRKPGPPRQPGAYRASRSHCHSVHLHGSHCGEDDLHEVVGHRVNCEAATDHIPFSRPRWKTKSANPRGPTLRATSCVPHASITWIGFMGSAAVHSVVLAALSARLNRAPPAKTIQLLPVYHAHCARGAGQQAQTPPTSCLCSSGLLWGGGGRR